jgi:hypothetical protein
LTFGQIFRDFAAFREIYEDSPRLSPTFAQILHPTAKFGPAKKFVAQQRQVVAGSTLRVQLSRSLGFDTQN